MNCIYKKWFEYKIIFASRTKLVLNAGHSFFFYRQLQYLALQGQPTEHFNTMF